MPTTRKRFRVQILPKIQVMATAREDEREAMEITQIAYVKLSKDFQQLQDFLEDLANGEEPRIPDFLSHARREAIRGYFRTEKAMAAG